MIERYIWGALGSASQCTHLMQSKRHLQSNRCSGSSRAEGGEYGSHLHLREAKRRVDSKLNVRVCMCVKWALMACQIMASSIWALTSPAGLNKEHFGLILEIWAVCIIEEPESFLQLTEAKKLSILYCSLLWAKLSVTLFPCILVITSLLLIFYPLSTNSVTNIHRTPSSY